MRICFLLCLLMLLTSCQSAITEINESIPLEVDVTSAKELVDICSKYIISLWRSDNYYVGEVFMHLNKDMVGYVDITFADDSQREPPRLALIRIDTENRKILNMHQLPRADKIYPGRFKLTDWKIDSSTSLDLAKQYLGDNSLTCNKILFRTSLYENGKGYDGVWLAHFFDHQKQIEYDIRIDPYSGEVLYFGLNDLSLIMNTP